MNSPNLFSNDRPEDRRTSEQRDLHRLARPRKAMDAASSYAEWSEAAMAYDDRSGATQWKRHDGSGRYDYRVIRRRMDELSRLRRKGDPHELLYFLNEGMHGNVGGMGSPGHVQPSQVRYQRADH